MKPICRKCLLSEIDKDKVYSNVYELIDLLPPDKKADDNEYKRRLEICKSCDELADGMCAKCGCFVELRAAKKAQYCPHEIKKW